MDSFSLKDEMIYDGLTRARGHMAVVQKEGPDSFLTENPQDLIARGEFQRLPMVGGVTRRDGVIYLKGENPFSRFSSS